MQKERNACASSSDQTAVDTGKWPVLIYPQELASDVFAKIGEAICAILT